jgi:hypothetical protein
VTLLLQAWVNGDNAALDALIPIVFDELRRMAHRQISLERAKHTLQSDASINSDRILYGIELNNPVGLHLPFLRH